jgi:GNAT superfamily N-acetyltransferase
VAYFPVDLHDLKVRHAVSADVAAIASLSAELGYPASEGTIALRLAEILAASATDALLVAVDADAVVGWIHVAIVRSIENDLFGEIRGLVVTKNRRGRGIGGTLVKAAEGWVRQQALPRIRVRTNVTRERTHLFYERMGYVTTKSQKVFDKRLS